MTTILLLTGVIFYYSIFLIILGIVADKEDMKKIWYCFVWPYTLVVRGWRRFKNWSINYYAASLPHEKMEEPL